jgi:hypothetical protein
MKSSTSNWLMHFSMAMEAPACWLVRLAVLAGNSGGANAVWGPLAIPQGSIDRVDSAAAAPARQNRAG